MAARKLVIASDTFTPRRDGIASFLRVMIPELMGDYAIQVIAPDFGQVEEEGNVELIRFPVSRKKLGDLQPCWPSYRRIREVVRKADLVWVQTIGPVGSMAILAGRLAGKPVIAYNHSVEWELVTKGLASRGLGRALLHGFVKRYARFVYNRCHLLMAPSLETAELLGKAGIRTRKKVLHLGTNTSLFMPPADKQAAKQQLGINAKRFVVGYCGRLGLEKNLVMLYRAFVRLRRRYPEALLLVVGAGNQKVEALFRKKPDVMAVGAKRNVVPYLQAMDVHVLPSLTETTSLSTLEAMATGIAVVSTPVGYVKTYIKDNVNGRLVPKGDAFALYKVLRELLTNAAERNALGWRARRTVVERFSWTQSVQQLKEVLAAF